MSQKKSDIDSIITINEWTYIFRSLENTQVLGREIGEFSKLMSKIDAIICDLMEKQKAPSDDSSLKMKIKE